MKKRMLWWGLGGITLIAAVLWGPIVSRVEQAKYSVVESQRNIEIRDYAPMIVAEVDVLGERKAAINQGFRMIADYIFGNNTPKQDVAMTAPVIQEGHDHSWKISFVMPANYTMETLPKPNNDAVKLKKIPGKRFAVIRFSGIAGKDSLKEYTDKLNVWIKDKKLQALSPETYAFFNPPWTLPFLRRNEVMVEVAQ